MGFFKDFKEDLSQAVNELMPGEDNLETAGSEDELVVNTLEGEVDVESELSKLDGLLEQVTKQETMRAAETAASKAAPQNAAQGGAPEAVNAGAAQTAAGGASAILQNTSISQTAAETTAAQSASVPQTATASVHTLNGRSMSEHTMPMQNMAGQIMPDLTLAPEFTQNQTSTIQEERKMADSTATPVMSEEKVISDEVSIITEGTVIKGDIVSNGSLDVRGQVEGNVGCNGKLVVTGVVNGNSNSSEFFADAAQIEGEVVSSGTVKIGLGSVIIGNVTSTSAVIAGAIKGDIDVQGPVVVDTSAVVMGNIKSRSVQINNGAVIEGFCSQCYSDVDVKSLFDAKKGNE